MKIQTLSIRLCKGLEISEADRDIDAKVLGSRLVNGVFDGNGSAIGQRSKQATTADGWKAVAKRPLQAGAAIWTG
jgi:hypothetical protein